jgi:hypothetical protein
MVFQLRCDKQAWAQQRWWGEAHVGLTSDFWFQKGREPLKILHKDRHDGVWL